MSGDHEAATPDSYYVQGALEFHSLSSYGEFPEPYRPVPEPSPDLEKECPAAEPGPGLAAVADILKTRRSVRHRRGRLDLPTAERVLRTALAPDEATGHWPYPSAGDLRAVTVYCAAFDVVGAERRISRFDPRTGSLRAPAVSAQAPAEHALRGEALLRTSTVDPATVQAVFLFVGHLGRAGGRYGERAYRYLLLEAGHMAQNLSLVLAAQNLAGCPIGGIHDDEARRVLGLTDPTAVSLYGLAIP
jgi:SagB-type dehydrogenase family enzyme